jgi:hypothetical protein
MATNIAPSELPVVGDLVSAAEVMFSLKAQTVPEMDSANIYIPRKLESAPR